MELILKRFAESEYMRRNKGGNNLPFPNAQIRSKNSAAALLTENRCCLIRFTPHLPIRIEEIGLRTIRFVRPISVRYFIGISFVKNRDLPYHKVRIRLLRQHTRYNRLPRITNGCTSSRAWIFT